MAVLLFSDKYLSMPSLLQATGIAPLSWLWPRSNLCHVNKDACSEGSKETLAQHMIECALQLGFSTRNVLLVPHVPRHSLMQYSCTSSFAVVLILMGSQNEQGPTWHGYMMTKWAEQLHHFFALTASNPSCLCQWAAQPKNFKVCICRL